MSCFKVAEKFVSINGEGPRAGELAVFLRFCGCNLDCGYCDTRWANTADVKYELVSAEELVAYVKSTGVKNVTLTGGEPLLQADIAHLIKLLGEAGAEVEIETNGSVPLKNIVSPVFGKIKPVEITEFMKERKLNGVRLQLQLHKIIWEPDMRGV